MTEDTFVDASSPTARPPLRCTSPTPPTATVKHAPRSTNTTRPSPSIWQRCSTPNTTAQLIDRLGQLDPSLPTVVYCAGGYRSSIAASTLRAHGFTDVSDLLGGYLAWTNLRPTLDEQDS